MMNSCWPFLVSIEHFGKFQVLVKNNFWLFRNPLRTDNLSCEENEANFIWKHKFHNFNCYSYEIWCVYLKSLFVKHLFVCYIICQALICLLYYLINNYIFTKLIFIWEFDALIRYLNCFLQRFFGSCAQPSWLLFKMIFLLTIFHTDYFQFCNILFYHIQ